MSVLMVTYDLHKPDEINSYKNMYDQIKRYTWCHALESVWFIDTNQSCKAVCDGIIAVLPYPQHDQILIVEQRNHWYSLRLTQPVIDWLKSPNRTWA